MLIALIVLLLLLVGALSYGCWNLLKKNEELEDAINVFYARTNATIRYMRFMDERQMFERDDEVGEVFKILVETVERLYSFVTEIKDGDITTKEEKQ
jgi:hypothetical protein